MDEYSCYLSTTQKLDRKRKNKNKTNEDTITDNQCVSGVQLCSVINNPEVIPLACELAHSHHFTLAHLRLSQEAPNQDICLELDKWVGQLADSLEDYAFMAVILGGRSGEGNGASFIHLKRPPELPKQCVRSGPNLS